MNYSTRKHLERLMDGFPEEHDCMWPLSPSPRMFGGIKVIESRDVPRYTLPEELLPGVPWPPGFREETNRWALVVCGSTNMIPRGTAYMIGSGFAVMNPRDVVRLDNLCA